MNEYDCRLVHLSISGDPSRHAPAATETSNDEKNSAADDDHSNSSPSPPESGHDQDQQVHKDKMKRMRVERLTIGGCLLPRAVDKEGGQAAVARVLHGLAARDGERVETATCSCCAKLQWSWRNGPNQTAMTAAFLQWPTETLQPNCLCADEAAPTGLRQARRPAGPPPPDRAKLGGQAAAFLRPSPVPTPQLQHRGRQTPMAAVASPAYRLRPRVASPSTPAYPRCGFSSFAPSYFKFARPIPIQRVSGGRMQHLGEVLRSIGNHDGRSHINRIMSLASMDKQEAVVSETPVLDSTSASTQDTPVSDNSYSTDIGAGKPGFISFRGGSYQNKPVESVPHPGKEAYRLVWFVGPTILVSFLVLPSLYLRKVLSAVFEDSLLTVNLDLYISWFHAVSS
ncbi:hypothetical protein PR202_ga09971 [Eleusine coracana subsp. coracana]|uniref:Uncharacterized protein n=1 Tax=Eleusine coracana subsp. coracana TaxID=191504 RepID=A0AAV5C5I9_ELECO|nr:hypothetical protein PR202_ga09971 [Eleusine coracana subsp. coracana]